jgi:ABC-type Fe3+-hydroxamate transport system substrate-binding protein
LGKNDQDTSRIPKIWKAISQINAVINERVYILKEDYLTIPGPRFILITEKMASIIHPEIAWEQE